MITAYNGSTKVATVANFWEDNPDNTTTFAILPFGEVDVELIENGDATDALVAAAASALATYDPPTKAELDAAVLPLALEATAQDILVDTGTTIPGTLATIAGYIDTEVASIISAIADLPTNSELATALAGADDAVLAAVADVPTNAELAAALAPLALETSVQDVKAQTDLIPGTADGYTWAERELLVSSAAMGLSDGFGTPTIHYRALDDSKDRITATVNAGNRTAVTLDPT